MQDRALQEGNSTFSTFSETQVSFLLQDNGNYMQCECMYGV